ncbi:MAG: flagellar hook-basal body protein [Planctomycetales bacterium]|nr:flagellar hook-basal body protein [Planctomycetales bacterium]
MLSGLYSTARAMHMAEAEQHVISRNLAHITMPGFRKQIVAYENQQPLADDLQDSPLMESRYTQAKAVHSFEAGRLEHTQRPLDVAIQGDGFFELEAPSGPVYTRNGVFIVNGEGQLTNMSGYPVQGVNGPIEFPDTISPSQIQIGFDGTVTADGNEVGRLKIASFQDNRQLLAVGDTLFQANGQTATEMDQPNVMQGYREMANVDATTELVHMIMGMRHHEAAQRAMREISESVQRHMTDQ